MNFQQFLGNNTSILTLKSSQKKSTRELSMGNFLIMNRNSHKYINGGSKFSIFPCVKQREWHNTDIAFPCCWMAIDCVGSPSEHQSFLLEVWMLH